MEIKIRGYTNGNHTLDFVIELPPEIAAVFMPSTHQIKYYGSFRPGNPQPDDIMGGYLDWLEEKKRREQDDEG